ncbi:MAG: DUF421 domain-containing protein [Oscillospiraceae bacterium]
MVYTLKVFVRSAVIYLVLLLGLRLMGKRQMGELELNELVIAMLLSDMASTPVQDLDVPLHYGIVSALTLLLLSLLLSFLCLKSLRFRTLFCGNPTLIIREGQLLQRAMRRSRFTVDELIGELRVQGVTDLRTVKYAILETNGQLSLVLQSASQPLTPGDLGMETQPAELPVLLISDGRLLGKEFEKAGLDEKWLGELLRQHGLRSYKEVFFLSIDAEKQPLLIPKDRR